MLTAICLVTVSVLRPDLNVVQNSLSYYAIGPWGALQTLAFVALGVTSIALAIALAPDQPLSLSLRLCALFLTVAGVAGLGLAYFPMGGSGPATPLGDADQTAGTIGGVAELAATLAFILTFRANGEWQRLMRAATVAFTLAVVGAIITQVEIWWPDLGIPMGASMRLVVIPLLAFWGAVALRLSSTGGQPLGDASP
jgi:hypothetical protein